MIESSVLEWLMEMRKRGAVVRTGGDKNLSLSRRDFEAYMLVEADGLELLNVLESGAYREAEERALVNVAPSPQGVIFFRVPDWRALVTFLRAASRGLSGTD